MTQDEWRKHIVVFWNAYGSASQRARHQYFLKKNEDLLNFLSFIPADPNQITKKGMLGK
jgi:hypothetical protein